MIRNFLIITTVLSILLSCNSTDTSTSDDPADQVLSEASFIGSTNCQTCHEKEYDLWENSHHDLAMLEADSTSVLGDFNNQVFTSQGVTSRFFREDDKYLVTTQGPTGSSETYEVVYTFGVYPLQQYLIPFPNGAYQCLQVAWDSEKNQWFDLQPDLKLRPDDWLHWTGGAMRWNTMCADCHSTDLRKNFDFVSESYQTTFSEINVGCESCHGPGSEHASFYENESKGKPPVLYMPKVMNWKELVQKCARCHSRRSQFTDHFDYRGHFLDHYEPSILTYPTYEKDGQIYDEDYVYSSFTQSKMYLNGVSCRDCHDSHSLKLKKDGNALCMSCHVPKYDTPEHHFHKINTEASQCVSCHMTGKVYMGNDFRRDHSFRVPRPDQTVAFGTPNACNGCHNDKSAEWAAIEVRKFYGDDRPSHFSDLLLPGYTGDLDKLHQLIADTTYPGIARATAISVIGSQPLRQEDVLKIRRFVDDSSPLVRNETVKTLESLRDPGQNVMIRPLLNDPIRMVRISAARYMNSLQEYHTNEPARKEYLKALEFNADFASGQQNLALHYQAQGNNDMAIKSYEKALEIDNRFNQARMNLALLRYQKGAVDTARDLYLEVIAQEPEYSYAYYMLGLLFHETDNLNEAIRYLALACDLEPINYRAFYNYALILQKNGQNEESRKVIERALDFFPTDEQLLYIRLISEMNMKKSDMALTTCRKLISVAPENPNYRQILSQLLLQQQSGQ